MKGRTIAGTVFIIAFAFQSYLSYAQKDTLRVMAYNVLYYGNGCQGPNSYYHNYLKTIVAYASPDILSLEKVSSIPVVPGDKYATAPLGFADSILQFALNAAFPGRYAYCTFTNNAKANNQCLLFYNRDKLGFISIVSSYTNLTDFNTWKLYYKDPNLARTHDTAFLYVLSNHDKSGDEYENIRALQIAGAMRQLKSHFKRLPNIINLGDFNARGSDEPFYQTLTEQEDTNFRFYDPPFFPDQSLSYPAKWDHDGKYSAYFTTSTREVNGVPNSCGSAGGAKNWYDHIFISSWIMNNVNHIRYIPNSYRTIGNDGQRFRVGISNRNIHANTSAPAEVIEALYLMSNKYPVMISLEVAPNTNGTSPANPEIATANVIAKEEITITNPVTDNEMTIHFSEGLLGVEVTLDCIDKDGVSRINKTLNIKDAETTIKCKLPPGEYLVRFSARHNVVSEMKINVVAQQ